jgi:hypothetical protein
MIALQLYVEALAQVRPEALQAAGADLIFIGCGEASFIKQYRGASFLVLFALYLVD